MDKYLRLIALEYKKHYDMAHMLDMTMGDEQERSYHSFIAWSIKKEMHESQNKDAHLEVLREVMRLPMFECAMCGKAVYYRDINLYQKHDDLCPRCSKEIEE